MQDLGELLSPPFFAGQAPGTLMENRPSGGRNEAMGEVQPQEGCHQAHGPPDTDPHLEANRHRGCTSHPRYAGARLVGSPLRSHKRSWGFGLALVLSFPVRTLSRWMPRGLAILISFLAVFGLVLLVILILVPLLVLQVGSLVSALPDTVNNAQRYLVAALDYLDRNGLLPGTTDQAVSKIGESLSESARDIAGSVLGGAFGVVSGTFSFALSVFGVVFVAAYMLIDVRRFKTAYLLAFPARYRRDARDLWNAFGFTLSRYLNGLALDLFIQGAISAVALYLIGVPYALALGAFVSLTALIPYIGAWLGAIPSVIVAFTVSPTAVILTAIVFLAIQQLEGNFLMPKIQGQSLHVHPVLVFLAVIIGGGLAGLVGVLLAVPTLAVLRVLFDFVRARVRTGE